ncbi:MAG: hypothetical protein UIB63_10690 [Methanobrevibacter sp.]|uniref:DUF6414 family protein n=1 Tax=Methanobrevibacter sp. TaxID=66852 RepID=UPI002E77DA35|nr:hypothetical protein [Methanobrevibacter sp.]MEE0943561.1 hypothetical protein [Methanobrevibacter sp.]
MEKIREYIYLDVDRIKSIVSQIEKGLIIEKTEESGHDAELKGNVGSNLLTNLFLDFGFEGDVLFTNRKDETKVLHDYMYNLLEKKLDENGIIIKIPNDYGTENYRNNINPDSFILMECMIKIENYTSISDLIDNINELQVSFEVMGLNSMSGDLEVNQWDEAEQALRRNSQLLDESYLNSLSIFFNQFYNGKIFIKCMPFDNDVFSNFIGFIKEKYLREDIEDIIFKYGSFPSFKWYVFGQISSIPPKNYNPTLNVQDSKYKIIKENWEVISKILNESNVYKQLPSESKEVFKNFGLNKNDFIVLKRKILDLTFENLFDIIDSLSYETSIKYPSIKFTPIAVYR